MGSQTVILVSHCFKRSKSEYILLTNELNLPAICNYAKDMIRFIIIDMKNLSGI